MRQRPIDMQQVDADKRPNIERYIRSNQFFHWRQNSTYYSCFLILDRLIYSCPLICFASKKCAGSSIRQSILLADSSKAFIRPLYGQIFAQNKFLCWHSCQEQRIGSICYLSHCSVKNYLCYSESSGIWANQKLALTGIPQFAKQLTKWARCSTFRWKSWKTKSDWFVRSLEHILVFSKGKYDQLEECESNAWPQ